MWIWLLHLLQAPNQLNSIPSVLYSSDQTYHSQQHSTIMNGEERAKLVLERCQLNSTHVPCTYKSRPLLPRMLPLPSKRFVLCALGKTGSSNWRTLILILNGKITPEEANSMVYPHAKEYWLGNGSLHYVQRNGYHELARQIEEEFYKITFVRDPLSRLLSAYRDKFTGNSTQHEFLIYRVLRTKETCAALQRIVTEKPDGDLIPDEIYAYIKNEIGMNCKLEKKSFVSLGMFMSLQIFIPQNYGSRDLRDLIVNTHFVSMLSLCDHCQQKFDFIGTLENMENDYIFLKNRLNLELDLPSISSTQPGVASKKEVSKMWSKLPELLKQYVLYHLQDDAIIFGYDGYETSITRDMFPNHYEEQRDCHKSV